MKLAAYAAPACCSNAESHLELAQLDAPPPGDRDHRRPVVDRGSRPLDGWNRIRWYRHRAAMQASASGRAPGPDTITLRRGRMSQFTATVAALLRSGLAAMRFPALSSLFRKPSLAGLPVIWYGGVHCDPHSTDHRYVAALYVCELPDGHGHQRCGDAGNRAPGDSADHLRHPVPRGVQHLRRHRHPRQRNRGHALPTHSRSGRAENARCHTRAHRVASSRSSSRCWAWSRCAVGLLFANVSRARFFCKNRVFQDRLPLSTRSVDAASRWLITGAS